METSTANYCILLVNFNLCLSREVSDLSLWLQSCDSSPFQSRCVIIARGYLLEPDPPPTPSHPLSIFTLAPNETACFSLSTKPHLITDTISCVVLLSWTTDTEPATVRGYTQLTKASFSIGNSYRGNEYTPIINNTNYQSVLSHLSNISKYIPVTIYTDCTCIVYYSFNYVLFCCGGSFSLCFVSLGIQDIKEFMKDEWKDLACVIGSRMKTKVIIIIIIIIIINNTYTVKCQFGSSSNPVLSPCFFTNVTAAAGNC